MERVQILESAEEIANFVLQSELADHYNYCLQNVRKSNETQEKIRNFVKMKEQYEEIQRFGKYHPDYRSTMIKVRELKREMDLDYYVAEFRKAENDLQALLDEISIIIGRSVSDNIKVPTGDPFFDRHSGGGCGSGGSCGCSSK